MRSSHLPFKISTLVILFILLFSAQNIFAQSGWYNVSTPLSTYNYTKLHVFDSLKVAVETNGNHYLWYTSNGGTNWVRIDCPNDSALTLKGIVIADSQTLYGWTEYGFHDEPSSLYRSTNLGIDWSKVWSARNEYSVKISSVKFTSSNSGYLVYQNGSTFTTSYIMSFSSDSGINWNFRDSSYSYYTHNYSGGKSLEVFSYWGDKIAYGIFRDWFSPNFGGGYANYSSRVTINSFLSTISIIGSSSGSLSINSISSPDSNYAYLATNQGLKRWSNSNNNLVSVSNSQLHFLYFKDAKYGFADLQIQGTTIHTTADSGKTWGNPITFGFYLKDMKFLNSNIGYLIGSDKVYKTVIGGGLGVAFNSSLIPIEISLLQNYPNPFNPTTKINFDLKSSAFAMLRVYDITGREVRTLVNEKLSAGSYSYDFNASELPSGVYFYQLQTDGFIETKKMILLK